ncbi:isoprenylcysteine carboxylmethyltransferase family protein [Oleiagrimonas sp. MCCC 1A03011]|jgi:protein-S-isoprenylcysteine O-methyltransferase Ste14|uniref:methyltransferase family protein n=1 Tax=Oleiagrimonas sp. MCCC 1A03011 TaxID=1926883 RepID=UPI000DC59F9F|nr:isoprenylcysteine carboxylmethyltransferase family protein [Oleiagrimonas sp. MCCC 1A03011]RAP56341.1 hypothetical protein BTJ49_13045 [Oleiagrimonas sp. MCCC 1A03011]
MNPFILSWIAWLLIWLLLWAWSKRTRRHESSGSWSLHMLPLMIAAVLLSAHHLVGHVLEGAVVPYRHLFYTVGLALTWAGLAFAVWARLYIGRNWSASVQVKVGHELVRSGPYRFVRHPIYTGLLFAFLGSALAMDQWRGVVAVVIVLAGFVYKLRLEERWMIETFGDDYRDYRRRTYALVPFVF